MKYALVTGSTKGLGFSIAEQLISKGYFVFINGRSDDYVNDEINNCKYIAADLSTISGVINLCEAIRDETNTLDYIVLNAGTTCRKKISDITLDDWEYVMNTNVNMPFFIIQNLLSVLNENSSILFVSSALGIKPHSTSLPYGVSKSAVIALTQNLVKELSGIRVNCICPGFIDTEWQMNKPQWLKDKIASKIILKRFAKSEEIADMCFNILSNTYMNGSVVSIDGGYDFE